MSTQSPDEVAEYNRVMTLVPMKLTPTQFRWLLWLAEHGGRASIHGVHIVANNGDRTNGMAALPFLNLVAKGCVEGRVNELQITDYGKRMLKP